MSRFFDALKAGAKATVGALGAGEYVAGGRAVNCLHCGGDQFTLRSVPTHEVGAIGGLWGYALRCDACTYVMLFGDAPMRR